MCSKEVFLINPPGWILNAGGPYIALPLIKSALHAQGIQGTVIDANLDSALFYDLKIDKADLESIGGNFSLNALNKPYFREQNKMQQLAAAFSASWDIQLGYIPSGYDYKSSESVRELSTRGSVYTKYFLEELIPRIQEVSTPLIGLSVIVPQQLLPTFEFCRLLRGAGYEGKILLGGNLVTRIGSNFSLPWVFELIDGLILFQGEKSLPTYYKCLNKNLPLHHVPNLIWRDGEEVITNKIEYLRSDEFSRPDFSDLRVTDYWGNNYFTLLGSRGCYYGKCSFCAIPYAYGNDGFLGHDKPSNVLNDITSICGRYGVSNFKFTDEALHPTVLQKLSEDVLKEGVKCSFEGYARFDDFWRNERFLNLASKAGLRKVYLGLELIQSSKRDLLNKADSDDALEMLRKFHGAGIKVHVFTLFGYPGTGVDEAIDTIQFALEHKELIDTLDVFPFYYAKHTKVPLIRPLFNEDQDWAIEYDYEPTCDGVLRQYETGVLCEKLEEVIWEERPEWLHPTYRMISPFGANSQTFLQHSRELGYA
ncbi:MAG TPA: radical SAM protein [Nitrososphaera sp.]|nr:radical SAM protein [Nitrososphaera sp.]